MNGCPKCPFHGMSLHKPSTGSTNVEGTRPTGNPYAHLIVSDEDKRIGEEFKKMYCGYTCKNNPERGGNYCKCVKD